MEKVFLIFAVVGCVLWAAQLVLGFLGADHGGDVHHDFSAGAHDVGAHDGSIGWMAGLFTIRGIIGAITFFGLGGLAGIYAGRGPVPSLVIAIACALGALAVLGLMAKAVRSATQDGTININVAVGKVGQVYLHIPPRDKGKGKVTLKLQERTVEFQAVSRGPELPTGAQIVVTAIVAPDTVEVIPAVL